MVTRASPISRKRVLTSRSRQRRSKVLDDARGVCRKFAEVDRRAQHVGQRMGNRLAAEQTLAAEHLEQDDAEAQMSARLSTGRPAACSGLMYAAVPRIIPACVIAGVVIVGDCDTARRPLPTPGSIAFASPKSSTFTVPSARTLMFAGLRSRWMMPCSCAASSASAICFAIGSASSSGIAPRAIRCDRSSPSTSSITSARTPPLSSRP